jgi:hypothetical protein
MRLRRMVMAGLLGAVLAAGVATPARATDQEEEARFALVSGWSNLWYVPAKMVVALVGLPVGAVTGWLSGGDVRTAYAIWTPTVGGTWFMDNDVLEGRHPIQFFGDDYADRPTTPRGDIDAPFMNESVSHY